MKEAQGTAEKKRWSGRTVLHGRHRRSVPLGNVRVECRSTTMFTVERCMKMTIQKKEQRENVKKKAMGVSGENSKVKEPRDNRTKRWSGRTV